MDQAIHLQHDLDPIRLRHSLPDAPGVYLFRDPSGRVIYVGKAKSLRKRVLSYLRPPTDLPHKTALMMKRASGLDYLLTNTEKEAFILEDNLVKKHIPRYNVVLRDDKRYPCLRLDINDPYPRLSIVRRIKKDGALYFGPFSSANAVRSTLKFIERVFPIRKCTGRGVPKRTRPCLNYEMDRCLAPCTHEISGSEYSEIVHQVRFFLEGRNRELIDQLRRKMLEAGQNLEFEHAAKIRDQIKAIEKTVERQHVVSPRMEDQDIIGVSEKAHLYQLVILFVRKGALVGSRDYVFRDPGGSASGVVEGFLKQYYLREPFIPKWILISEGIEDLLSIAEWLSALAGHKVAIQKPLRGEKLRLLRMAVANAENLLRSRSENQVVDLMDVVKATLKLKRLPKFIEGLDISNLHGDEAVGAVVSFVDGLPHRAGYRNYKIKAVKGINDYGMMTELMERRVNKGELPELFLVDGGKGHLSVVERVLDKIAGPHAPEVISIAKPVETRKEKLDKIYVPGRKNPIRLKADHPALLLMMRIRDEAHRRAITYHRRLRAKTLRESELDRIPGIGKKRKKVLLDNFSDIAAVAGASVDDLARVPGINRALANNIFLFFQEKRE
jgi:excinuclease ABC subunit C